MYDEVTNKISTKTISKMVIVVKFIVVTATLASIFLNLYS